MTTSTTTTNILDQAQEEAKRQALLAWIRRNAEEAVWLPQVQAGKR